MRVKTSQLHLVIAIIAGLFLVFWFLLPNPLFDSPLSTVIVDKDGVLLGATVARDDQWRFPKIDSVPYKFSAAVTTFEDKRFFKHHGVDPAALGRALLLNIKKKRVLSGGSTITMQTIRLSRHNKSRTFIEKLIEIILALRLELTYNKNEILCLYASHAPFGGNVVGLEAAGWRYFGCDLQKLTWAECAMLAVLPNSPSLIHPGRNRDILLNKRNKLIQVLKNRGIIDSATAELSKQEPLPQKPFPLPLTAPHLLFRVEKELSNSKAGPHDNKKESKITTTLDVSIHKRVVDIISHHYVQLSGNGVHNAAALVINNRSGAIVSYVGNIQNSGKTGHGFSVDIITAPRSTGSILKPLLYAAMIESGELIPSQLIQDLPLRIGGFSPQNYSRSFEGAISAHMALARSLNVPAVSLLKNYGVDRFYALLKNAGMSTLYRNASEYGLTLILGGAEGTLMDIAGIYSSMARTLLEYGESNFSTSYQFFSPYYTKDHHLSLKPTVYKESPFNAASIWQTFEAMEEVVRPEDQSTWKQFSSSKRIAWKTGTSFGFRDAWAVGVTPEYTVGVWVGNAEGEGRPNLTGITCAAPVLFDIFSLFDSKWWFGCPEADLVDIDICSRSGYKAGINCKDKRKQKVTLAGRDGPVCPYCRIIHCDSTLAFRIHSDCEQVTKFVTTSWFVLPPSMEWYYRKKHFEYNPLPPWREDCIENKPSSAEKPISIIFPKVNTGIYIPLELNGERGKTVFEAAHRQSAITIYWHIDNEYLGSTRDIHQMSCSPVPGIHVLTLVDEIGECVERRFEILAK